MWRSSRAPSPNPERVLELIAGCELGAEFIGSEVFGIEVDGAGDIVEGLANLHFKGYTDINN
jgi:hypothetical protein